MKICETSALPIPMVNKGMVISKGSYGHGESKNVLPKSVQTPYLPLRGSKVPSFMGGSIGSRMNQTMVISKGIYGHAESKNVLPKSVQTPYLPLRGSKVPRFIRGSIGPRMEICETSALPIPMVPRFNQSNGYIKRNLRAWRVQKCIALVSADTVLATPWRKSTPFHGG